VTAARTGDLRVVVTGASRGIGRAIAKRLAPRREIIALARDGDALATLAAEIEAVGGRCRPVVVDLADRDAIAPALAGIEADVLVHNAGIGVMKPLVDLAPDEWHRMIDVNLNALYHVTRAVLPGMIGRRSGHIVFIGSIAGRTALAGGSAYAATKWAVMGMSESLMLEVREHGVKVSVVNPGSVASSFSGRAGSGGGKLSPEDVASAVAFVIDTPPEVLVHRVEVRIADPSKPRS
jgi:NADP-dependent 3-hydroxy acid dehydrogenase YdfG